MVGRVWFGALLATASIAGLLPVFGGRCADCCGFCCPGICMLKLCCPAELCDPLPATFTCGLFCGAPDCCCWAFAWEFRKLVASCFNCSYSFTAWFLLCSNSGAICAFWAFSCSIAFSS